MKPDPAFSAVARDYDATFTDTAVGKLQRVKVWDWLAQQVTGSPTVLELNCGTGADAVWMARRGWQVLATDVSPEMVRVANEKIGQAGVADKASARVCSFAEIGQLPEGPFDLIFSNFGGLNCIPREELERLGHVLFSKLNPGGQIAAVVMGRFCWWETLYFLLKLNPSQAFRRLKPGAVQARLNANTTVPTWYYSPSDCASHFTAQLDHAGPQTVKVAVYPVGFWLPPSYLDPFFAKRPRLLRLFGYRKKKCAPPWLSRAADHYLISLIQRP